MYFQKFPFSKILCVLEEYLGLFSWRKAQLKFFVFGPCRQMFPFVICLHGYPLHKKKKTVSTLDLGTFNFLKEVVFFKDIHVVVQENASASSENARGM